MSYILCIFLNMTIANWRFKYTENICLYNLIYCNIYIFDDDSAKYIPTNTDNYEITTGNQSPVAMEGGVVNVTYNNNDSNNTSSESTTSSETNILKNDTLVNKEGSQFDFAEAIRHSHNNELVIKEKIVNSSENIPVYSSIYPGVSYSQILNGIRLIEVTKGYREYQCSRLYHFDENGKLTFALIDDDDGEHRLYFYNDMLIRYIDIDNNIYDINYGLENFECKWTELALEESYELFNGVKRPSGTDVFSVTASYDSNTPQTSTSGINILVKANTSLPAERVTISAISDNFEVKKHAWWKI